MNFIDFCKLVKFKNSRFCLNVTSEIGTVTFAFRRKLKTKIVDFDLKVFFWIASLNFNVKSAFLARLTNFIDIINFQSIFFCLHQNPIPIPTLFCPKLETQKCVCVYFVIKFSRGKMVALVLPQTKIWCRGVESPCIFEAQKTTTTTSVKRP